jgi:glutathione S-transferase
VKLLIGNKNYSSWSLRAWLALRHFDVPFEEELLLLCGEGWKQKMNGASPTGRVPTLIDGDLVVPETLAIIEYVADIRPEMRVWPKDLAERAQARAAAAEMHAGFAALRNAAPMNIRASYPGRVSVDEIGEDLARLEVLWGGLLARSGGPFLFGAFTGADAMFAPVASRVKTYALPVSDAATRYVAAIHELSCFQEWRAAALEEPWIVEQDEIDFVQGRSSGASG